MTGWRFYVLLALAAFAVLTLLGIHMNIQQMNFAVQGMRDDAAREVRKADNRRLDEAPRNGQ